MALLHYRAHLNIARDLKDTAGEACALLNLANCLSTRSDFVQAIPYYENYLMLSQVNYFQFYSIILNLNLISNYFHQRNCTILKGKQKRAIFWAMLITV